jgi:hypothetical protein
MDQSMPPEWPANMGVNPKDLLIDHMTPPSPGRFQQHLSPYGDSIGDVHHSLRYLPNFGNPHQDFLGLAGPNVDVQGQDVDMSALIQLQHDEGLSQFNGAFGTTKLSGYVVIG